jgi:hypothetical protein
MYVFFPMMDAAPFGWSFTAASRAMLTAVHVYAYLCTQESEGQCHCKMSGWHRTLMKLVEYIELTIAWEYAPSPFLV